jgi:sigma-B regulation protein RsbU (phosphoserine phosphatase)
MMPGMDGYEVLRRLKAKERTRDIPVIFVTAMSEVEDEAAGLALGAVDYITKPISPPIVKARVKTQLTLRSAYRELEKQRDRMQYSIDLASEIQRNMLPGQAPQIPGLDIAGLSRYCDETGGDYFDYLLREEDREGGIAIAVGDVSGHGLQAALLMTTARAFLRQRYSLSGSLEEVVKDVNRSLAVDVEASNNFMTLFFCEIDRQSLSARWVRAGHEPGVLFDGPTGEFIELEAGGGMPLGVMPNWVYRQSTTDLSPGQILCIGTDGIWEVQNHNKEFFGKDRFKEIVSTGHKKPAREIVREVIQAVDDFRGSVPREDDVTLVVVKII